MSLDGQPVSNSPSEGGIDQGGHTPDPPTPDWSRPGHDHRLDEISARMDELGARTSEIADALGQNFGNGDGYDENGYADGYDEYDDDGETVELTPEEYARLEAEHGDEIDAIAAEVEGEGDGDLIDRLASTLEGRLGGRLDAQRAIEDREAAWDELRQELPILQDEATAARIVHAAQDQAMKWDPRLVDGPEFVQLVSLIAHAAFGEQALERERGAPPVRHVQLEGASGAKPAQPSEPDWGQRMLDAAERIRPMI